MIHDYIFLRAIFKCNNIDNTRIQYNFKIDFQMKILLFILTFSTSLITLVCGQGISPPTLISGWERIYIKNTGYFDLPPTMEVQKGKYKEIADENRKRAAIINVVFMMT